MANERPESAGARWCRNCDRPDRDLALDAMRRAVPGSAGYYNAMSSWTPEPCECEVPNWEPAHD